MTARQHPEVEFTIDLPGEFGRVLICYRHGKLRRVRFAGKDAGNCRAGRRDVSRRGRDRGLENRLRTGFRAYFSGKEVAFDYPLDLEEFTPLQRAVWAAMREIPYGQTRSYQWVAERIGKPRAARAVGNACGKNPLPIVQPCHRVVGLQGRLGGFSAGLDLKKVLLKLEGVDLSKLR